MKLPSSENAKFKRYGVLKKKKNYASTYEEIFQRSNYLKKYDICNKMFLYLF